MFDKIIIKSGSRSTEKFLSIPDIVDMMFYYGEVHVVVSQFELEQLLRTFGEDVLYELITSKLLFVHPCDQHIGAVFQNGLCSAGMFRHDFSSIEQLLYMYHRVFRKNSTDNMRFASKFSKILSEYRYPDIVQNSIYRDIEDDTYLSKATQIFIKQYYPKYHNIGEISLHAEPIQSQLGGMYRIEGNIRLDELNAIHQQIGYPGAFSYSNIFLAIGESNQDCYMSSELRSELITSSKWAEIYKLRLNECISNAEKSKRNIDFFQKTVAFEFMSPGTSFSIGQITPKELVKLLNEKNSLRFKDWLKDLPNGVPISGEFYNEIRKANSDKPWVKILRVLTQSIFGLANPLIGIVSTSLDGFIADKIINGWKPQIFVEKFLRNEKLKQDIDITS